MTISIRRTGQPVPVDVWDDRAMAQVASAALGTVATVDVRKGDTVNSGDLLVSMN